MFRFASKGCASSCAQDRAYCALTRTISQDRDYPLPAAYTAENVEAPGHGLVICLPAAYAAENGAVKVRSRKGYLPA